MDKIHKNRYHRTDYARRLCSDCGDLYTAQNENGCDCDEILSLIEQGKIDSTPLITHRFALKEIEKAYEIFENKLDGVIKIAVTTE